MLQHGMLHCREEFQSLNLLKRGFTFKLLYQRLGGSELGEEHVDDKTTRYMRKHMC